MKKSIYSKLYLIYLKLGIVLLGNLISSKSVRNLGQYVYNVTHYSHVVNVKFLPVVNVKFFPVNKFFFQVVWEFFLKHILSLLFFKGNSH